MTLFGKDFGLLRLSSGVVSIANQRLENDAERLIIADQALVCGPL